MRRMRSGWLAVLVIAMAGLASADDKAAAVDGTWKWTYKTRDGKDVEAAVKLKRDGAKLSGAYVARDGKETPIEDGQVKGDEVTFNVTREIEGNKMVFKYSGKVSGDTIAGKIVFGKDKPTPHEWEAKRVKG